MKSRILKEVRYFIITVTICATVTMTINIFMEGMYLWGIPKTENVQEITVSYPELTDEAKEFSDEENIELAVQLTGFLKYALGQTPDENETPLITITYYLNNGESTSVSASKNTVWWNGKAYALKKEEMFINLAEGIFFWEEVN